MQQRQLFLPGFELASTNTRPSELEQRIRDTPIDSLFFAIYPSEAVKLAMARFAAGVRKELRLSASLRKYENLHATLHDLNVYKKWPKNDVAIVAMKVAAEIDASSFDVIFDRLKNFGGGAIALSGDTGVEELLRFRELLGTALQNAGLRPQRGFTPHVTLMYSKIAFAEQVVDPSRWRATEFALVNSHVGKSHHEILGRWQLKD
jgi:2'-5' RNA ligase